MPSLGLWRLKAGVNMPVDNEVPFGNSAEHKRKFPLRFWSLSMGYKKKDISYPGQWDLMKTAMTEIAVRYACGLEEGAIWHYTCAAGRSGAPCRFRCS